MSQSKIKKKMITSDIHSMEWWMEMWKQGLYLSLCDI